MGRTTDEQKIDMIKMYKNGIAIIEIAKYFNISVQAIYGILKRRGLFHYIAKTNDAQRLIMVKMYESGLSTTEIAEKFNITYQAVISMLRNRGVRIRSHKEVSRRYDINEHFFDKIDSQEKAYFLGILFADGYNSIDRPEIILGLAPRDKEILEKLIRFIYPAGDRPLREYKNRVNLVIINKHMSQCLNDLGCVPRKSLILKYPHYLPPELHRHFIRGFFDGDGCIYSNKPKEENIPQFRLDITSTEHMCKGIQQIIFERTSISPQIKKTHNSYRLFQGGNKKVRCVTNWLYKSATIFMKRKHDKYLQLISYYEHRSS